MIGEDDELSHEHGQREFLGFAGRDEAEVKRFEDRVAAGGHKRGHVEDRADAGAAASDVTLAPELAAVVVEGSDAGQGGGLGVGEGAELGHERHQRGGGERADALDLLEAIDAGEQLNGLRDLRGHQRFELGDLFLEEGRRFGDHPEQVFVRDGLCQVVGLGDLGE